MKKKRLNQKKQLQHLGAYFPPNVILASIGPNAMNFLKI
jgi:hypothetical protein